MKRILLALLISSQITQAEDYITFDYTFDAGPSASNIHSQVIDLLAENFDYYNDKFWRPSDDTMLSNLYNLVRLSNPSPTSIPAAITNSFEYTVPDGYELKIVTSTLNIPTANTVNGSIFFGRNREVFSNYQLLFNNNVRYGYPDNLDEKNFGDYAPTIKGPATLIHEEITRPDYVGIRVSNSPAIFYYFRDEYFNFTNTYSKVFTLTQTEQSVAQETLELLQAIASQTNNTQTTTITNTITNTVGYTLSEVADMRYGSKMVAVSNNTANLTFRIDAVSNLESNWNPVIDITIPFDVGTFDIGFFRVREAEELTTNEVDGAASPPNMNISIPSETYQEVMENLHESFRNSTTTPDDGGFGESNATPI